MGCLAPRLISVAMMRGVFQMLGGSARVSRGDGRAGAFPRLWTEPRSSRRRFIVIVQQLSLCPPAPQASGRCLPGAGSSWFQCTRQDSVDGCGRACWVLSAGS